MNLYQTSDIALGFLPPKANNYVLVSLRRSRLCLVSNRLNGSWLEKETELMACRRDMLDEVLYYTA